MRKSGADNGYGERRSERIEPTLGPQPSAPDAPPPGRPPPARPRPRKRRWVAVILAIAGIALLLLAREPLSDWLWPETRVQQLRADAARALQAGELTRTDGRGARELYEAALALDPDRPDAREGLVQVGRAALARAEIALAQGRDAEARRFLQLARELAVPRAQTDMLARRLRQRVGDGGGVDQLLAAAETALEAGRLDGADDAALPLYQRVLALQPHHTAALEGREDTLSELLQRAESAMQRDDPTGTAALIARVQMVDPGHVGLPAALAALAGRVDQRLQQADKDLEAGRWSQALDGYRAVAAIDAANVAAARGVVRVANAHAARSERLAADFRFVEAQAALIEAQQIAPNAAAVIAAKDHLDRARRSQARLESGLPPAQRDRRVRELLDAAAAAEARGDLLDPPGESAYDKVRAAQAIAPREPAVDQAAQRLAPAAGDCFRRNLQANALSRAGACLDAWRMLGGTDSQVAVARRRLASSWVAYGNERLGAYELATARSALAKARELDPNTPGVADLADRLARAIPD
ncbi:hypothetical protein GCM10027191_01010 [Novilysobacter erysipheiresistens]